MGLGRYLIVNVSSGITRRERLYLHHHELSNHLSDLRHPPGVCYRLRDVLPIPSPDVRDAGFLAWQLRVESNQVGFPSRRAEKAKLTSRRAPIAASVQIANRGSPFPMRQSTSPSRIRSHPARNHRQMQSGTKFSGGLSWDVCGPGDPVVLPGSGSVL